MNKVRDASAMIAYVSAEPGGADVRVMLDTPKTVCYAHVLNLCEVYYHYVRTANQAAALLALQSLRTDGVIFRDDLDTMFWQSVGDLKAQGGISLPDCFCVVLSQRLSAEAVTADRAEFTRVQTQGLCPVYFIR